MLQIEQQEIELLRSRLASASLPVATMCGRWPSAGAALAPASALKSLPRHQNPEAHSGPGHGPRGAAVSTASRPGRPPGGRWGPATGPGRRQAGPFRSASDGESPDPRGLHPATGRPSSSSRSSRHRTSSLADPRRDRGSVDAGHAGVEQHQAEGRSAAIPSRGHPSRRARRDGGDLQPPRSQPRSRVSRLVRLSSTPGPRFFSPGAARGEAPRLRPRRAGR